MPLQRQDPCPSSATTPPRSRRPTLADAFPTSKHPRSSIGGGSETQQSPSSDAVSVDHHEPAIDTPPFRRHSDLWFEDGSVICRAEDTLFKVHMSVLARHSEFFKDMFSMPQPKSRCDDDTATPKHVLKGIETGGIPVVELYDTAEDVGNLLTALYDGPAFGGNDQEDFPVVSGVLRLSTKYIIEGLRARALEHLSTAWPSDLKAWDAREDSARTHETDIASNGSHLYPHPIAVINLSREVDAPSLLPAAFYDLSRYPFSHIFEPTEEDQTHRHLPPTPSNLSVADLQRLCLGKEASQHAITSLITAMGSSQYVRPAQHSTHVRKPSASGVCVSAAACRKDFSELVDLATQHYLFDRERGCCDPLYVAEELGQLKSAEFSECKACAKSLEAWATREREKMWKSIPVWFRLEHSGDTSPRLN
ncbi:hypothetical protein D9615_003510 [Tricholomella constricta]|uniref:BTB domain-containing protein n=1 Tax=Tricholomella constricta TaxID=117010 RepID=A0A8H5HI53_9AGAR|nr:hypothetical protein D9615_003510 [Tricholomella constricta]